MPLLPLFSVSLKHQVTNGVIQLEDFEASKINKIADCFIPRSGRMPAASEVDVGGAGLRRVFSVRPDLCDPVRRYAQSVGAEPFSLESLLSHDGADLDDFCEAIRAAYYLDPGVIELVGYGRREPSDIVFDNDLVELTSSVTARGPIWRPVHD